MKTQTLIYLVAALGLGLLAGYLLFGRPAKTAMEHDHSTIEGSSENATAWTCSMHPQIQQNEPGDCPLCGMELIPLVAGNSTDPAVLTMTEAAVAMARVQTMTLGGKSASTMNADEVSDKGTTLELTGRLSPDERTAAVEVSEFGGRIERLFVSFAGEEVRVGQRIATVYSPDLVVAQEELLQARKFAEVNPELVDAARKKLRNLKVTEEQIAQLEATGKVISNFPVYANNDGTILATKAEVGEYVKAGGALYTFTNLSKLWALFDAYEQDLARISVGDKVSFSIAARPAETYQARITFIDPSIDPKTRTAAVRAEVSNRSGKLKPEMFIKGNILLARKAKSGTQAAGELLIPRSAVLWTGQRSVAYVELPNMEVPTYEFREITLSDRVGDNYRVTSGLAAGDRVVINGAFQIDAAAQLNNKASMMNRDVLIQGRKQHDATEASIPDYEEGTPMAFRKQLSEVVEAYLPIKDKMVATEPATQNLVESLLGTITKVDMTLVKGDAHLYWMQQLNALQAHAKQLAKAKTIAEQRKQFGFLSQALVNVLTAFGVDGTYYVQYCPMAFDNAGANWLSNEDQIRNPYFGELMMKCGSVTAKL